MTGKEENLDLIEIIPEEIKKEREELRNYFIKATNIEDSPEEMKVLDDIIIRLQQLGFTLKTRSERDKYKRAFEILKDNFFIDLIEREDDWKLGFEPINPIKRQPRFIQLPKEEAELLEELMKDA